MCLVFSPGRTSLLSRTKHPRVDGCSTHVGAGENTERDPGRYQCARMVHEKEGGPAVVAELPRAHLNAMPFLPCKF